MSDRLARQSEYWNREAHTFHRIYSHEKPRLLNLFDRVFRRDMYERFAYAMDASAPVEGRRFLDVGCGSGVYSVELARRGAAHVTGLDIAEDMLGMCREAAAAQGLSGRCEFVRSDLLQFVPAAPFDITLGIGLLDYIPEPLPVLRKMREVTRHRVILSFPRLDTWRAPVRWVRLSLRGCEVHFYTRRRIERLLEEAGFPPSTLTRVGKLYCVAAAVKPGL